MLTLIFVILFAALLGITLKQKIHNLLPVVVMGFTLLVYFIALLFGSLMVATDVAQIACLVIMTAVCIIRLKSVNSKSNDNLWKLCREYIFTAPFFIFIFLVVLICVSYSNHYVYDWDDLSYWGIYAKTLLSTDKIPPAIENCTVNYKDYTPIQQIMQYLFMYRLPQFNETDFFRVNTGFLYTMMLPFIGNVRFDKKNLFSSILKTMVFLIFPHIFSTQFYYKLGIDYLIAVLFGYAIYAIVEENDNELLRTIKVIISSSYMALLKTSGAFICIFITLFYCVYRYNDDKDAGRGKFVRFIGNAFITFAPPMVFYISWKVWGRISGNHGYLSDRVSDNIASLKLNFPDYTLEVVLNYIKHFFSASLTREKGGMSAAIIVALMALMYFAVKSHSPRKDDEKRLYITMLIGFAIFCAAHIYMYLFVFDDWEAHGLLEFDRYITQYLGGAFYFCTCIFLSRSDLLDFKKIRISPVLPLLVVMLIFFPYRGAYQYLIPNNYTEYYNSKWKPFSDRAKEEWDSASVLFDKLNWTPDENKQIGVIADAWSDELQFMLYDMVPFPATFVFNSPAIEQGNIKNFILSQVEERNIRYVYIMSNSKQSHIDEWDDSTSELTDKHVPLEEGHIYETFVNDNQYKFRLLY